MLNLTPHAITVETDNGHITFEPSGTVARVDAYRSISDIKDYCDFEGFSGYAWQIVVNLIRELDLDISYRISNFY